MFKLELSIILSVVLFTPLSTLADIDLGITPNFPAYSSFTDTLSPFLTVSWSHSNSETNFSDSAFPDNLTEQATESLNMNSLLTTMDSRWIYNATLPDETTVYPDNFDSLCTDSNTWLVQAYLHTDHRNKWNRAFASLHLNISSETEIKDSSTSPLPFHKSLSGALLLIALIGWSLARPCQNSQDWVNASSN